MSDYAKMKNSELEALLKQRSLPHTGKKADMVARLVEADKAPGADAPTTGSTPAVAEAPASAPVQAAAPAAPEVPPAAEAGPTGATDGAADQKPTDAAIDTATTANSGAEVEAKPAVDFSSGMAATSIDEEIERRKKRAAKFGVTDAGESEAIKALERAKRFGTTPQTGGNGSGVGRLDEALSERSGRKRGRGHEDDAGATSLDDPGLKRRRGGGGPRGRGGRGGRGGGGPRGERIERNGSSWMSDADRKAVEARKARFA